MILRYSQRAPWVKYDNIVGLVEDGKWLRRVRESGDGFVPFRSAHLEDVPQETVVEADHMHIQQHPLTILEVRRILGEHSREMYAELGLKQNSLPAGYNAPLPPNGGDGPQRLPPTSDGPPWNRSRDNGPALESRL